MKCLSKLPNRLKFIVMSLLFIFFIRGLYSQSDNQKNENQKNSLLEGSYSLQFQIMDKFILNSFQGAIISAKYHYSDHSAIRVGVGVDIESGDNDTSPKTQNSQSSYMQSNNKSTEFSINFSGQYVYYPKPAADINLYYGCGPLFRLFRSKYESENIEKKNNLVLSSSNNTSESNGYSIGVNGLLGVEWFATKSISFIAEYSVSTLYMKSKNTNSNNNSGDLYKYESESNNEYFRFEPVAVKFGLSVYF
jgi:hypothetical protein